MLKAVSFTSNNIFDGFLFKLSSFFFFIFFDGNYDNNIQNLLNVKIIAL